MFSIIELLVVPTNQVAIIAFMGLYVAILALRSKKK